MLTRLLHAHSGLRYLVLLAGIAALIYALVGLLAKRPYDRGMRATGAAFAGLLHLQVLLGLILLFQVFYPALIGHLVLMMGAAVAAQLPLSMMKRRPSEERTYLPHAIGAASALLLIWLGVMAIERGLLEASFL